MGDVSIGHVLIVLIVGSAALGAYFTPSVIAVMRKHKNAAAIIALNFFVGWTIFGWVIALVWALTSSDNLQRSAQ